MSARPLSSPNAANPGQTPVLRSLAEGEVLCREGDPPGPLYVICSGSVRAYRLAGNSVEELAHLGPGEIVGEMAPILQQARSATVQALEPTEVLEVPVSQVQGLLKQHQALVRVLTVALKERAGVTPADVHALVKQQGAQVNRSLLGRDFDENAPVLPAPAYDASIMYPKRLLCPTCGAQFFALVVPPQQDRPVQRSVDFHQLYRTPFNPYDYEIWVCPNDLYAAFPADFATISELQRPRVREVIAATVARWGEWPDFNVDRNLDLREKSLHLALALYRMRHASQLRMAATLHRLAWCARERGDAEAERGWLAQALQAYSMAYNQFDDDEQSPKTVLRVAYLCAELNAMLGDMRAAVRWSSEGLRHPRIKEHPHWERMLREQWAKVRTAADAGG